MNPALADHRIILAFAKPPERFGFRRAKSGKCWWCKIAGRERAIQIARQLTEVGIRGLIRKIDPEAPKKAIQRAIASENSEAQWALTPGIIIRDDLPRAGGRPSYDQICL